jgi:hypothetical protein
MEKRTRVVWRKNDRGESGADFIFIFSVLISVNASRVWGFDRLCSDFAVIGVRCDF